jgi:hypothetical protein
VLDLGQLSEDLRRHAAEADAEALPALVGLLEEVALRARARVLAVQQPQPAQVAADATNIGPDRAAEIAGTTRRWILDATRGLKFRRDLSRKQPRFDEAGLRAWLAERNGRRAQRLRAVV